MARFIILAENKRTWQRRKFIYDNMTSELLHEDGRPVVNAMPQRFSPAAPTSKDAPLYGKSNLRIVKIQLGLSCNYSCSYCSQRFVPHATETNPRDVERFMEQMAKWFSPKEGGKGCKVQYWGGEPFVYWKTLKPLAEAIRERYPNIKMGIVSNGSLLDTEKNEWLDRMGFSVGISHDGPGQHVRGPDPFADPEKLAAILDLYKRLGRKRMSINSMMHKSNPSRAAINQHMVEIFGKDVRIGEGGFIDSYDEGGLDSAMPNDEWGRRFARAALDEIRTGQTLNMMVCHNKIQDFVNSIKHSRPGFALGQKCGMDRRDTVSVDLRGNVLTCQNLSAESTAPNGQPHKIGHVSDIASVKLDTSTHWSRRPNCQKCPMLQLCQGSCMFLEGERWEASCRSSYFDSVPFFAAGIEFLTGYVPFSIQGDMPEGRKTLFSDKAWHKIIPIWSAK